MVVVLRCRIVLAAAVVGAEQGHVARNQRQAGAQQQQAQGKSDGHGGILGRSRDQWRTIPWMRRPRRWLHAAAQQVSCAARPRSEEPTAELQSLMRHSYAVFCLNKKTNHTNN